MPWLLRTIIFLPLVAAIVVVVLLAVGLRMTCRNLMKERSCAAL